MRAINLLILPILSTFSFIGLIETDQIIDETSFVASNHHSEHQFDEPLVKKIKCHNRSSVDQEFTASIKRPPFFTTTPIIDNDLESRFSLFSNFKHSSHHCRFEFDPITMNFHMKLTNFEKCGVSEMRSNDNKPYLSVSIRFAQLAGLRTKNDLNLVIICREQSKVYTRNHELDFRPGEHLTGSNTRIFANEPQQFHVKLQLYAADHAGSRGNNLADDESTDVNGEQTNQIGKEEEDGTIEVGEMVRLNAVVRSGDGWNYAFLKDVVVSRRIMNRNRAGIALTNRETKTSIKESASDIEQSITKEFSKQLDDKAKVHHYSNDENDEPVYGESNLNEQLSSKDSQVLLVDGNGCRNPTFRLLAPSHPHQLSNNGLDVNFEFRAFIFENMDIKHDRLRISAKIVACQQFDDCRPVNCEDSKRRRRRWTEGHLITDSTESTTNKSNTKNGHLISQLERQLEFRIKASTNESEDYVQQFENDLTSIHIVCFSLMAIGLLLMSIILGCVYAGSV